MTAQEEVDAFCMEVTRIEEAVERLIAELPGGKEAMLACETQPKVRTPVDLRLAANAVPEPVIAALRGARVEGLAVRFEGRIDRRLFQQVDTVMRHLGGKWSKSAQAHVFTKDPAEALAKVVITGKYSCLDRVGFFPTSAPLVNRVVDLAEIEPHHKVLEPSAGDGRIADEVRRRFPLVDLSVIELQPALREQLQAKGHHLIPEPDFLHYQTGIRYDRIVMNPPFEGQADIEHVLHAYDLLVPGGKLVSIMAEAVTWRTNRQAKEFRAFLGPLPKAQGLTVTSRSTRTDRSKRLESTSRQLQW